MRKKIDFDEIEDWKEFEDLVADYFNDLKGDKFFGLQIKDIRIESSGEGTDGGRDILVTFQFSDSITRFERKWIIQCKFYSKSVGKPSLSGVNIPTLIHEYGADGYLLVCSSGVSSKVSEMFENLRRNCRFGYSYEFWTGAELRRKIQDRGEALIQRYFPEHFEYLQKLESEKGLERL